MDAQEAQKRIDNIQGGSGLNRSHLNSLNFFNCNEKVKGEGLRSMKIELVPDKNSAYPQSWFWSIIDDSGEYIDGDVECNYQKACEEAIYNFNILKIAKRVRENPESLNDEIAELV